MNRKIKFRFWGNFSELNEEEDFCEMEMLYGDKFHFFESEPINDLFDCRNFQVMQYTGCSDKNGKEIYEGDIIGSEYGDVIVRFDKGSFGYLDNDGFFITLSDTNLGIFEIKGNIYAN